MSTPGGSQHRVGPGLRAWFATPPRRHGEVQQDRTVSFIELFYDLVFVVLVAQVAHTLAEDVSWAGFGDFLLVFGMIWIAWFNGAMFHETHGREDGRSRTGIFVQMYLLVMLAVFAAHATDEDGVPFAVTYALLLALLALQWWSVRRYDTEADYRNVTAQYVGALAVLIVLAVVSALVDEELRLVLWAVIVGGWVLGALLQLATAANRNLGMTATESMAERFGLLTIIVLGEVVVGVVDGLIEAEPGVLAVVTGLLAVTIGFGFWWNYFDTVGRRVPRRGRGSFGLWLLAHLPLTAVVAAAGAGMVSLIEHAADDHAPVGTTWLLAGASAAFYVFLSVLISTIDYDDLRAQLSRRVIVVFLVGAAASLAVPLLDPQAWVVGLLLTVIQSATWLTALILRIRILGSDQDVTAGETRA